jgi:hypothetical protein
VNQLRQIQLALIKNVLPPKKMSEASIMQKKASSLYLYFPNQVSPATQSLRSRPNMPRRSPEHPRRGLSSESPHRRKKNRSPNRVAVREP